MPHIAIKAAIARIDGVWDDPSLKAFGVLTTNTLQDVRRILEALSPYEDNEVVGIDKDGCIVQWDGENSRPYNCGETPQEFGLENLTDIEKERIKTP